MFRGRERFPLPEKSSALPEERKNRQGGRKNRLKKSSARLIFSFPRQGGRFFWVEKSFPRQGERKIQVFFREKYPRLSAFHARLRRL